MGCNILFACRDTTNGKTDANRDSLKLFTSNTTSLTKEVVAYAIGKGTNRAKTELEKEINNFATMNLQDATDLAIKIMFKSFDPLKDKEFIFEIGNFDAT